MITVCVYINNQPIILKTARNTGEVKDSLHKYITDCGKEIWHDRNDGAVYLSQVLLDYWKEPKHG